MLTLASRSLPTRYRRIEQTLDRLEARFVRAVRTLQQERLADLRPLVRATLEGGSLDPLGALDLGKGYEALLVRFLVETLGAGLGHGQSELDEIRARGRRVRALFRGEADGEPVVPDAAVDFIRRRRDLGRFFDADQVTTIRELLAAALQEGSSVATVMEAMQAALVGHFGAARAENIARTEATTAYNQGRLQAFLQAPDLVAALQFMAVLDARTTDICQHRDGLVFKLDDPLLRENTPPCHFQCRSLLSPVPEWELEEMGGSRLLARHRKKMATAPPNQQTSRGRFGSEPWPDAPGGAAPVPRTGPVGPQAGGDQGSSGQPPVVREPEPARPSPGGAVAKRPVIEAPASEDTSSPARRVTVEPLPSASRGPIGPRPEVPKGPISVPPGLVPIYGPGISREHPIIREILWSIAGLPPETLRVMEDGGVRIEFDERNPFWRTSLRSFEDLLTTLRSLRVNPAAVTVTGTPGPADVTMFFRPGFLISKGKNPRWAAYHESGHAIARILGLVEDPEVLAAFEAERLGLADSFQVSPSEFLAEGFAYHHYSTLEASSLQLLAPRLSGIISGKMVRLQSNEVEILWQGPEGHALAGGGEDRLVFALNLGEGVHMGHIHPDGRTISFGGGSASRGEVHVSWSDEKHWTSEEAEPYKAFLRSKGITLPHVMS